MWELAAEQGIKVPFRDYWDFADATNVRDGTDGLAGLDEVYHLTELIQSSPEGVFRSVHGMLSGGYRAQRITTHEVRFNPAKRNRVYRARDATTKLLERKGVKTPEISWRPIIGGKS